jgi:hypothetical protein
LLAADHGPGNTRGVSGDLVGRAVNAVLVPPQAERFASLTGADPDRLVLNVNGWNKLVLVDSDRVFLFPRSAGGVEWFERELTAYRALAGARLSVSWSRRRRSRERGRPSTTTSPGRTGCAAHWTRRPAPRRVCTT